MFFWQGQSLNNATQQQTFGKHIIQNTKADKGGGCQQNGKTKPVMKMKDSAKDINSYHREKLNSFDFDIWQSSSDS